MGQLLHNIPLDRQQAHFFRGNTTKQSQIANRFVCLCCFLLQYQKTFPHSPSGAEPVRPFLLGKLLEPVFQYTYVQTTVDMTAEATFTREIRPLTLIRDNYEKIILTADRLTLGNYNGIQVKNLIDWLPGEDA